MVHICKAKKAQKGKKNGPQNTIQLNKYWVAISANRR